MDMKCAASAGVFSILNIFVYDELYLRFLLRKASMTPAQRNSIPWPRGFHQRLDPDGIPIPRAPRTRVCARALECFQNGAKRFRELCAESSLIGFARLRRRRYAPGLIAFALGDAKYRARNFCLKFCPVIMQNENWG
jgi:hypothetical protein